jgi:hypothetical protein
MNDQNQESQMNEQDPITKVGAKLEARLNLGDYNHAELSIWVEDRVRPQDASTSAAIDRLVSLLDVKLESWARGFKDDAGTE